ncbi:MAG TPA: 6-phosphofructokinase [Polyangiaceae bacterium]|jgi:6-phosphofructokinase 1|nr:MAG: Pyrophosphate--fructose 6-phosphate 1-phosphotransferase [Deltaproteobacteria bacterium ADurb.Bin207]HNT00225.1 6-phosphofructokinase [Polyangiaceae bacterium]HNZ22402.1 6-phosphofructokinase [Polyangiaceae bacterium]HOD20937.1 6-phosphofructokinase [Polyangiaceae bacterium]HOE48295.1 6-phosphofructokinase [Polyangiaceae bacterium]
MGKLQGKAVVAQGGGPTAVINQSLVGAVLEARKYDHITHVYGARHGVRGIVEEDFLDLSQATTHNLEMVAHTPSSGLGSTRDKPDEEYCAKIFQVLRAHGVRYFYYAGGNDSADTCRIVNENANRAGYELRVIHIPKTIDNDLRVTDHCPGYGSAAKFVVSAFAGVNLDNAALPGVYIGIVMGRHAGFLTAASVFARKYPDDGPHLVYVPERVFDKEKFLAAVDRVYSKFGRCVIAVSEGIVDASGQPVILGLRGDTERDAHGNVQLSGSGALGDGLSDLIKEKLKIKRVRSDTFGYLQRSFLSVVSTADANEAREVGEKAVQYSVWNNVDGSVAIRRTGDYSVDYFLTELESVAKHTKHMPEEYLEGEADVSTAFKNYARPLIGNFPHYERIAAPVVDKILGK